MKENKLLEKWLFGIMYLIPLTPLIVHENLLFPYITGKAFFFRTIITVAFVLFMFLYLKRKDYKVIKSPITISIASFLGIMFVANLFGVNPSNSFFSRFERMEGFVTLVYVSILFFILSTAYTKERLMRFFVVSIWISLYICIYVFMQKMGMIDIRQGDTRVDGTFGNAIYLAVYMLFNFFLTLYYIYSNREKRWIIYTYSPILILQLFSMYLSASRGVILGTIISIFLITLSISIFGKEYKNLRRISAGALILLVSVIGIFLMNKNSDYVQNSPVLSRFANISLKEITIESRFLIWDLSVEGFKENPILGYGQENFNYVFNKHYTPELYRQEPWFDRAHNVILDWLIAGGILGLIAYISLYLSSAYMVLRNSNFDFIQKNILLGLLFAYGFNNFFVFDNLVSYIFFFSILAYIQVSYTEGMKKEKEIMEDSNRFLVLSFLIIFIIITFYTINIKAYSQGRTLIEGMRINISGSEIRTAYENGPLQNLAYYQKALAYDSIGDGEIRQNLLETTIQIMYANTSPQIYQPFMQLTEIELKKQISEDPENALYPYLLSRYYALMGRFDESLIQIERARELSKGKQDFVMLHSKVLLAAERNDEALNVAREGYEMKKENPHAWVNYYEVAEMVNDEEIMNNLVNEIYENNEIDKIDKYLRYKISSDKDDKKWGIELIKHLLSQGRLDQARLDVIHLINQFPSEKDEFEALLTQ